MTDKVIAKYELDDDSSKMSKKKAKKKNNRQYSYFQALYLSMYSPKFYIDVFWNWRGIGARYLLFVAVLLGLPFAVHVVQKNNHAFTDLYLPSLKKLPPIMLQGGIAKTKSAKPYLIKDNEGQVVIVVDTSKTSFTEYENTYKHVFLYIGKDRMKVKLTSLDRQESIFPKTLSGPLNGGMIIQYLMDVKTILNWAIYPSFVLSLFSLAAFVSLVLSGLLKVYASIIFKFKVSFITSVRLTVISFCPGICLLVTYAVNEFDIAGLNYFLLIWLIGLYTLAIVANKRRSKELVVTQDDNG